MSHSRHAPRASLPASNPNRPHGVVPLRPGSAGLVLESLTLFSNSTETVPCCKSSLVWSLFLQPSLLSFFTFPFLSFSFHALSRAMVLDASPAGSDGLAGRENRPLSRQVPPMSRSALAVVHHALTLPFPVALLLFGPLVVVLLALGHCDRGLDQMPFP